MSELFEQISNAMADVVEAAGAGVVRVDGRKRMAATGITWREDVIVTANHVVRRDEGVKVVTADGTEHSATVAGRDQNTDIAVLRVEGGLTPLPIAESGSLRVGNLVLAIGRPRHDLQATHGVVSAIGSRRMEGLIQTDVVMYPGFSGGPLVDASGHVQGMNTSGFNRGASIAIGNSIINSVVDTLLEHGKMRQAFLGIGAQAVRLPEAIAEQAGQETGLMLVSVESGSPAEAGGLLLGDVMIAFDGAGTPHLDALMAQLTADRIGNPAPVQVLRGGEIQEISVTCGEKA